ncbi:MAG: Sigma-70 family polymerase sigma factor [Actinomycetota bacterium]|nr:Sigma-70 family polymerase sigma factor [Actinomycetota bacterium]
MNFKPKTENELARLKDDELISFAVDARDVGDPDTFESVLRHFAGRRIGLVDYWVSKKADGDDKDEIVGDALASIIKDISKVKGSSPGEVVEWMRTVTQYRIADFYRAKEKDPGSVPIPDQPADDDSWGPEIGIPDSTGAVEVRLVVENVLKTRDAVKQEVIRLRINGYSSKEAAEMSNDDSMSPTNVDKIFSRYRKDVATELWDQS